MALVDVYYKGTKVASIPTIKGEKGDPFRFEDFTPEQLDSLRGKNGMTIIPLTESQYAATTPESGVLYIVTADS